MIKIYRFIKHTFSVTLLLCLSACGGSGGEQISTTPAPVQATLAETIDGYLQTNVSANDAGLSVLVRKNGSAVYKSSKGLANKASSTALTNDTGYRLASVSKLFTALAVMQMYEQGQLQFSDPVRDYLPELPDSWQSMTIHHLLSHQSGIPDYANDYSGSEQEWVRGMTNAQLIEHYTVTDTLEFAPGTQADYSNSGFVLLAQIVSRISGLSFPDYMQANIFHPIGMTNSYVIDKQNPLKQDSALNFAESVMPFDFELHLNGAAAQVSSLNDMNLFVEALMSHEIVSQASFDLMTQAHSSVSSAGGTFGYGWHHGTGNVASFDINGSFDGYQTLIIIAPAVNLEVVILTNGGATTAAHKENIFRLINEFYNQQ